VPPAFAVSFSLSTLSDSRSTYPELLSTSPTLLSRNLACSRASRDAGLEGGRLLVKCGLCDSVYCRSAVATDGSICSVTAVATLVPPMVATEEPTADRGSTPALSEAGEERKGCLLGRVCLARKELRYRIGCVERAGEGRGGREGADIGGGGRGGGGGVGGWGRVGVGEG
jgi:hypothetical protein